MSLESLIAATAVKSTGEAVLFPPLGDHLESRASPSRTAHESSSLHDGGKKTADVESRETNAQRNFSLLLKPIKRNLRASALDKRAFAVRPDDSLRRQPLSGTLNAAGDDTRLSPARSLRSDVASSNGIEGLEQRKERAFAQLKSVEDISVSSRELRLLHFLASVDHGNRRPEIGCAVETKNFRLQWLLNPSKFLQQHSSQQRKGRRSTHELRGEADDCAADERECAGDENVTEEMAEGSVECSPRSGSASVSSRSVKGTAELPFASLNLRTMPCDILLKKATSRKPDENKTPLLNSPRSVLTCLRNGTQPMELQQVPLDAMILELSSHGVSEDMVRKRHKFAEELRVHKLEVLRKEYDALCEKISLTEICTFFEFLALEDGLQAPDIVEEVVVEATENVLDQQQGDVAGLSPTRTFQSAASNTSRLHVKVNGDATIFEAIQKIETKAAADREKLQSVLSQELENTRKKAETFATEQRKNAEKQLTHQRELRLREEERKQHSAFMKLQAEQKAVRRAKMMEAALQSKLEEIAARDARAAAAERAAEVSMQMRVEQRRLRQERKQSEQHARLKQAEEKIQKIEEDRRERFAEKQRLRDALMRQKEFLRNCKKEEDARINHELQIRREEIAMRCEDILLQKQQRAVENARRMEERLRKFANEKEDELRFKKLLDLKRELNREEVFALNEQKARETVEGILERRKDHDDKFELFQQQQQQRREEINEREMQVLLIKEQDRSRHEQLHAFDLLLSAEECTRKIARGAKLSDAREVQMKVLQEERELMGTMRQNALNQAKRDMEIHQRTNYLQTFREQSPGDAVILSGANVRNVAIMKKTLGRQLNAEEETALRRSRQRSSTPATSFLPSSLSPIPMSDPRPATSLN